MKKVAVVVGTRPCIIKQWSPYVNLRNNPKIETILIHSGQHDEMAVQAFRAFNLHPDYILRVYNDDKRRLGDLVSRLIDQFTIAFYYLKPDLVLVHGDTSTAISATIAAFLQQIKIAHNEAGLRTSRFESPFPEEGYRRVITRLASYHFAPTTKAVRNLKEENITKQIYCVGNSVVDALQYILETEASPLLRQLENWALTSPIIVVTAHRRETYGYNLERLCHTVAELAEENPQFKFVWPVHENPQIRDIVTRISKRNIALMEPLDYPDFVKLLNNASVLITDSGGVLEEACVIGVPTIILRNETERPEALDLDNVKLIGYDFERLKSVLLKWIYEGVKTQGQPIIFGEGNTGQEIAEIIAHELNP